MAMKQIDPVASFQNLVDNVPKWRLQLSDLADHAAQKFEEYAVEYQRLVSPIQRKRQKSASVSSIHTHGDDDDVDHPTDAQAPTCPMAQTCLNPMEAGSRFVYAQALRRRKPGTSIRSNASGPRVPKSKRLVVIYYDSHIQIELDKVVKALGAARNTLRKGKLSYTAAKGFGLPATNRFDRLVPNPLSRSTPTLVKAASEPAITNTSATSNVEASFASVDKAVDRVQCLCEAASHQAIRDGDIYSDLKDAVSKLETVLAMASSAITLLEAEQSNTTDEISTIAGISTDSTASPSTMNEKLQPEIISHQPQAPITKTLSPVRPHLPVTTSVSSAPLLSDTIEVDTDDDNSEVAIDIDIKNYRTARCRIAA